MDWPRQSGKPTSARRGPRIGEPSATPYVATRRGCDETLSGRCARFLVHGVVSMAMVSDASSLLPAGVF